MTLDEQRVHTTVWITLVFWASNFILLTLGTALGGYGHFAALIPARILEVSIGLGFCFLIAVLLRRLPTMRTRLIALAIVAPTTAAIFDWANFSIETFIYPGFYKDVTWRLVLRSALYWTWFWLAWAGTYLAVSYSFDVREEQLRSAEIRERAHLAQLRALHSQINPHFLFNSLNSVSALIMDQETSRADEMVTKLAHFLRLGLAADPSKTIPLSAELELQQTYLELEQLRYQDLEVSVDVPTDLLGARVPPFILQPIIENAIKYGVSNAPPPARIELKSWRAGEQLHLQVIDSGKGLPLPSAGFGIGLSNVRQRLGLIYGDNAISVTADRLPDGRFGVDLGFPLEMA